MDNPELYSTNSIYQKKDTISVLEEFLPKLSWSEGEHVLDVGCGPGDVTTQILLPQLPNHIQSLVGIDRSPMMIKYAANNHKCDKVSFKIVDFGLKDVNKKLLRRHFSKIFSFYCLHWIHDDKQIADNLLDLLRPGGEVLTVSVAYSDMCVISEMLSKTNKFKQYCQNPYDVIACMSYTAEDLRKALTDKGFEVIVCEQRSSPALLPSLEVATRSFEALSPSVRCMPQSVRSDYLEAFKTIVRQPCAPGRLSLTGEVHLRHEIVVLYARLPI